MQALEHFVQLCAKHGLPGQSAAPAWLGRMSRPCTWLCCLRRGYPLLQETEHAAKRLCDPSAVADPSEQPERLLDSFDDADFYQQLLKEFLDSSTGSAAVTLPSLPKVLHLFMGAALARAACTVLQFYEHSRL